jgi:selenocysteine lyase/cysteine desulfurase
MESKKDAYNSSSSRRNFVKNISLGVVSLPFLAFSDVNTNTSNIDINQSNYDDINWKAVRKQFILSKDRKYFNTAGLGPSPKVVVEAVYRAMLNLENKGEHGHEQTEVVHEKLGKFLKTTAAEIGITRNATESMNIVARCLPLKAGDEIILTKHEHIGGTAPWLALQKDIGIVIKLIDLDLTGEKNIDIIKQAVSEKTKVVSFSHVTCTTGLKLPAKEIATLCREKGIFSVVDGAQALGMIPIDLQDINPDFYVASAHKWLFGPKGTGILFINKSVIAKCSPTFAGAYTNCTYDLNTLSMEYRETAQREEYGTRNTPITLGIGTAIDFISSIGIENIEARGQELATYFKQGLATNPHIEILSPLKIRCASSIVTFRSPKLDYNELNQKLGTDYGLRVRGIYENDLNGIRVSFAVFNSKKEVELLVSALADILIS